MQKIHRMIFEIRNIERISSYCLLAAGPVQSNKGDVRHLQAAAAAAAAVAAAAACCIVRLYFCKL